MLKGHKGLTIMSAALVAVLGMVVWMTNTLTEGVDYFETTHNGASCLAGGWCGHIPVMMTSLVVFPILLFVFCYGMKVAEKERKESEPVVP